MKLLEERLQKLANYLELANQKGAFNLSQSADIAKAIQELGQWVDMAKQSTAVKQKEQGDELPKDSQESSETLQPETTETTS